jgi:chemotaxis protein CheX
MSRFTAMNLVSRLLRYPPQDLDLSAHRGIGQLGGLIAGRARRRAVEMGLEVSISPPTLLVGGGPLAPKPQLQHCLVPVHTDVGEIQVHLAWRVVRRRPDPWEVGTARRPILQLGAVCALSALSPVA